jgi:SNF2 family DNA or RNA helicase
MLELRKCCIHPYLITGAEDKVIKDQNALTPQQQFQCMVDASGKLVLLDKLLPKLKAGGHRVLIFSQMTRCLDILQDYLRGRGYTFERIDGGVRGDARQAAIDRFSREGSDVFCFLLCTRAGGVGINLTAADTCVIYDSDWVNY